MSAWSSAPLTLGALAAAAIIFGCSANPSGIGVQPTSRTALRAAGSHQETFSYTGVGQKFKVPSGVKSITIDASAAAGAGGVLRPHGGRGGRVVATVPVTQGETLYVFVGGQGSDAFGGFNGGGSGGSEPSCGNCSYGGGGASDVRAGGSNLSNRIVIAGGGGGGGGSSYTESNAKKVRMWRGWQNATGNGSIIISW